MAHTSASHRDSKIIRSARESYILLNMLPDIQDLAAAKRTNVMTSLNSTQSFRRVRIVRALYLIRSASSWVVRYVRFMSYPPKIMWEVKQECPADLY